MADNAELATILQDYTPRAEYEAALDALNEAIADRDRSRGESEKHTGRLSELEKKLRSRSWRDGYRKLAKELKVKEEFEDDVYDLLKLEPDADEPDEKALRRTLEKFLDRKKSYVAEDKPAPRRELAPGEGATRGPSVRPGEPEFRVSRPQLKDAVFMRDNQKRIVAAQKAGLFAIDEEA